MKASIIFPRIARMGRLYVIDSVSILMAFAGMAKEV